MAQEPTTYITEELRAQLGVERNRQVSLPVERGEIRRWAIAVYWPQRPPPIYWDEEYAKATPWGGIIAPPDFNPFTWPVDEEGFKAKVDMTNNQTRAGSTVGTEPGQRILNGGTRVGVPQPYPAWRRDHIREQGRGHQRAHRGSHRPDAVHVDRDAMDQPEG